MKRAILVLVILLLPPVLAFAQSTVTKDKRSQKLELNYYDKLNEWVIRGGQAEEVQSRVVETCGKLIMLIASPDERIEFISTQEEEFHFRVDVSTKMTVNRVHKQPEFKNKEIISKICDESGNPLFSNLCKRSGLRQ